MNGNKVLPMLGLVLMWVCTYMLSTFAVVEETGFPAMAPVWVSPAVTPTGGPFLGEVPSSGYGRPISCSVLGISLLSYGLANFVIIMC